MSQNRIAHLPIYFRFPKALCQTMMAIRSLTPIRFTPHEADGCGIRAWFLLVKNSSLPIIDILTHPENDYHSCTGLKRDNSPADPNAFML